MGPEGMRSFRAVFEGSIIAVFIGLLSAATGFVLSTWLAPAVPGWSAFSSAFLGVVLITPAITARLMGVGNQHRATGYAFGITCGSALLALGILYIPLIPLAPTVVAGASVAGIRYAEMNEE